MNEWEELELKMGFLEIWVYCERQFWGCHIFMSVTGRMNSDVNRASGLIERDIEQAITALKKGGMFAEVWKKGKAKVLSLPSGK